MHIQILEPIGCTEMVQLIQLIEYIEHEEVVEILENKVLRSSNL